MSKLGQRCYVHYGQSPGSVGFYDIKKISAPLGQDVAE